MEVTIYNLVGPLGTVHSYTDREEAEREAKYRFEDFGDHYSVEETSLTVSDIFFSRIYPTCKARFEFEETKKKKTKK